ncbi:fused MFS/spermidine synthase [Zhihengliuella sp.]|uniref:spermidine synthase n=1 Tax=Zhihengliuella sp. TaxID=1954483 RepID=UPI0028120E55|nr:fused MFS/spermidine synthase [Zhihengliuella sp.]
MSTRRTNRSLSMASGAVARIIADPLQDEAVILLVGEAEQSHVHLADQRIIFYEYLQRISHALDARFPADAGGDLPALRVLHLGAGALTLPRSIGLRRPGSRQTVVDIERELVDFVTGLVPLPTELQRGRDIVSVVDDARAYVEHLTVSARDAEAGHGFDAVVLDIFTGRDSPGHLADPDFYRLLRKQLTPRGLLIVNVGDDEGMHFAREQIRALRGAFADVLATGATELFTGRYAGNIVAVASESPFEAQELERLSAAGPFPGTTLHGVELDGFSRG